MDGSTLTSILDVTTRGQQYVYSKSKTVTASEDTLKFSGHHLIVTILKTKMRCCLTYLAAVSSQRNKQERRYAAEMIWDLGLLEVALVS